ncbi:hypothetical protein ACNS7O_14370 [Haloferacaceae archaeon DSL9]
MPWPVSVGLCGLLAVGLLRFERHVAATESGLVADRPTKAAEPGS